MKYIIQGSYGSLRYWVKMTNKNPLDCFIWAGLIENATKFDNYDVALTCLLKIRQYTRLRVEISKA